MCSTPPPTSARLPALLAYPFLIEPLFSLQTQTAIWSFGFAVLAIGVCVAAVMAAGQGGAGACRSPTRRRRRRWRLAWMALTAIPAGLCIAVTAYITTDLAAAPFLWVLPLALYLLTFVGGVPRPAVGAARLGAAAAALRAVAPIAISILGGDKVYWLAIIALNLTAFVLMALACHGEAYRLRPEPARLTEFYLWTSFGGVLGGMFAGLIAPNVFNNTYEYPILIVAALLLLPGIFGERLRRVPEAGARFRSSLAALVVALRFALDVRLPVAAELPLQVVLVVLAALHAVPGRQAGALLGACGAGLRRDRLVARRRHASRDRAQLLRRASGRRDQPTAPIACCSTAPRSTAPSTCATRRASR